MSYQTFVKTTDLREVSSLSPRGQLLFRQYDVIVRELTKRLSLKHAKFFAEPEASDTQDRVDWYGPAKAVQPLQSLNESAQSNARREVARLFDDITMLSRQLESSGKDDDRYLARLLSQALRIPSETSIHVGPDGPLITDWGTTPRGAAAGYHVLRVLRDQVIEEQAAEVIEQTDGEEDGAATGSNPHPDADTVTYGEIETPNAEPIRGVVAAEVEPPQIPLALYIGSVIATLLTVPFILGRLLSGCAVTLPGFVASIYGEPFISYCEESYRNDTLLDLIESYERELLEQQSGAPAEQFIPNPGDAGPVPGPIPDPVPTAEPEDEPAPEPVPPEPQTQRNVTLTSIQPDVGSVCAAVVCSLGFEMTSLDAGCDVPNDWEAAVKSEVPDGWCRAFAVPTRFTTDAGVQFSARYEVLVDGVLHTSFDVEAETYSQQLRDVLAKNGHPILYWVADFIWPPGGMDDSKICNNTPENGGC